ncbi:tyrosine integrase [Gordonia phage ObLaDi]|uniref:Integrase n=1 Tax=Gordonia phage ObLaDi TaxID=2978487 RepID=A0A977KLM0_9CAUD|nr:tyrosine integrase [Gordonia phage ObLaDi]
MARPPLPLGTWGTISSKEVRPGVHRAWGRYRDYDGHTRLVEARGKSGAAAKRALREKFSTRARPVGSDLGHDSRFRDLAAVYFDELANSDVSQSSRDQYRANWDRYIEPAMGELRLREVTASTCSSFLTTLSDRRSTHAAVRTLLISIVSVGVRLDLWEANPAQATKPPRTQKAKPRALTLDEVRELRARVQTYDSGVRGALPMLLDVLDVMLGTGLRVSEVVPIRWDNIDFQDRTLTVTNHVVRTKGSTTTLADSRKSHDEDFIVRLPGFAISTLLVRRARVEGDWVFASRKTGSFISPNAVQKKLAAARGEDFAWVTSHTFRRTVATVVNAERDAQAAAAQLGHSNPRITSRHYIQRRLEAPDLTDVLDILAH